MRLSLPSRSFYLKALTVTFLACMASATVLTALHLFVPTLVTATIGIIALLLLFFCGVGDNNVALEEEDRLRALAKKLPPVVSRTVH